MIITAYTAPNLTKVAVVRFQGQDFTVRQTPKKVTTVWLGSVRVTKRDQPNAWHTIAAAAFAEWEAPAATEDAPGLTVQAQRTLTAMREEREARMAEALKVHDAEQAAFRAHYTPALTPAVVTLTNPELWDYAKGPRPTARVTPERNAVCVGCVTEVYRDGGGMLRHAANRSPFCPELPAEDARDEQAYADRHGC